MLMRNIEGWMKPTRNCSHVCESHEKLPLNERRKQKVCLACKSCVSILYICYGHRVIGNTTNICRTNRGISHIIALGFEHEIILGEHENTIRQTIWIGAFIVFLGGV
jgi:hypothetical protein